VVSNLPKDPKGRHIYIVRTRLDCTQTEFGALIGLSASRISVLETELREMELEASIAERLRRIDETLKSMPEGGLTEALVMLEKGRSRTSEPAAATPLHPSIEAAVNAFTALAAVLIQFLSRWAPPPGQPPEPAAEHRTAQDSEPAAEPKRGPQGRRPPPYLRFRRPSPRPPSSTASSRWVAVVLATVFLSACGFVALGRGVRVRIEAGCTDAAKAREQVSRGDQSGTPEPRPRPDSPPAGTALDVPQEVWSVTLDGGVVVPSLLSGLPVLPVPTKSQKRAPCDLKKGEHEATTGGCWWKVAPGPTGECPDHYSAKWEGGCYIRVPLPPAPNPAASEQPPK
jgi:hypothetical protein